MSRADNQGKGSRKSPAKPAGKTPAQAGGSKLLLNAAQISQLLAADLLNPFACLGLQRNTRSSVINTFLPGATAAWVSNLAGEVLVPMICLDPAGVFAAKLDGAAVAAGYRLRVSYAGDIVWCDDPYRFPSLLADADIWLFAEGRHEHVWQFLGAQEAVCQGVKGVQFAVWAPNARRVAVLGDFNHYDNRTHVLRCHPGCGIWEMFVPGPGDGAGYYFEVTTNNGQRLQKADPCARAMRGFADVVAEVCVSHYAWQDDAWLQRRAAANSESAPMSVYELHAGSWRRDASGQSLDYVTLAATLLDYVVDMGFTHIEFLPLTEHPFTGSWGYQPVGLYAPTCRFGSPDQLRALIDAAHGRDIGVILDWVPAHFPNDPHGLVGFDGTALYEHADPRKGAHPDWGTLIYNYGRAEVLNYLVSSAVYWVREFHIDGLRVDAVASMLYLDYSRKAGEWLPNVHGGRENLEAISFLQRVNAALKTHCPGVLTIAEESTAWPGVTKPVASSGLGFDYKWNMGWMHDTLSYLARDPVHRQHHHGEITFSMMYAYSEQFVLSLSHDEVVHGKRSLLHKMPGDAWRQFANLRLLLALMWTHPGKKLLFMGCEFGAQKEWDHDGALDWALLAAPAHQGVQRLVRDLNRVYRNYPALHQADHNPSGFEWRDMHNAAESVLAYQRLAEGAANVLVCVNLTPMVRYDYVVTLREAGSYQEIINSDSKYYGGSNVGNSGSLQTVEVNGEHRLQLALPPLGVLLLERQG